MEYTSKTPPSNEDPTVQIWSPDGHWIAEARERAWPGTTSKILSALNRRIEILPNFCVVSEQNYLDEISGLKYRIEILRDEVAKIEKETAEKCFEIVSNIPLSANNYGDRVDYARLKIQEISDAIVMEFNL